MSTLFSKIDKLKRLLMYNPDDFVESKEFFFKDNLTKYNHYEINYLETFSFLHNDYLKEKILNIYDINNNENVAKLNNKVKKYKVLKTYAYVVKKIFLPIRYLRMFFILCGVVPVLRKLTRTGEEQVNKKLKFGVDNKKEAITMILYLSKNLFYLSLCTFGGLISLPYKILFKKPIEKKFAKLLIDVSQQYDIVKSEQIDYKNIRIDLIKIKEEKLQNTTNKLKQYLASKNNSSQTIKDDKTIESDKLIDYNEFLKKYKENCIYNTNDNNLNNNTIKEIDDHNNKSL